MNESDVIGSGVRSKVQGKSGTVGFGFGAGLRATCSICLFGSFWVYIFLLAFKARHYTFLPSPLTLSIIFRLCCLVYLDRCLDVTSNS